MRLSHKADAAYLAMRQAIMEQALTPGAKLPEDRLAGEFHILLAERAGNPVLSRYLSEVATRCSLILAVYGRPHSSDCAITEHLGLIDALTLALNLSAGLISPVQRPRPVSVSHSITQSPMKL